MAIENMRPELALEVLKGSAKNLLAQGAPGAHGLIRSISEDLGDIRQVLTDEEASQIVAQARQRFVACYMGR